MIVYIAKKIVEREKKICNNYNLYFLNDKCIETDTPNTIDRYMRNRRRSVA